MANKNGQAIFYIVILDLIIKNQRFISRIYYCKLRHKINSYRDPL